MESRGQIFITTHSQNVIEEIDIRSIFKIKNNNGIGKLIKCNETFQGVVRACPEAAYANKVIVCEGKTEKGICWALDEYRIKNGKLNYSAKDVTYTLGNGDSFTARALKLKELGLDVCVFCDSDKDSELSPCKEDLKSSDIKIFDCEDGKTIENQVFTDLPWNAIKELIEYTIKRRGQDSVEATVKNQYGDSLPHEWIEKDTIKIRNALAKASIKNNWFKREDHGRFLGSITYKYFDQIMEKPLGIQLEKLSTWIDNE
jgi:putative ATP-dependent endonuclease of the OLD family